jgi:hypothetical protein
MTDSVGRAVEVAKVLSPIVAPNCGRRPKQGGCVIIKLCPEASFLFEWTFTQHELEGLLANFVSQPC